MRSNPSKGAWVVRADGLLASVLTKPTILAATVVNFAFVTSNPRFPNEACPNRKDSERIAGSSSERNPGFTNSVGFAFATKNATTFMKRSSLSASLSSAINV